METDNIEDLNENEIEDLYNDTVKISAGAPSRPFYCSVYCNCGNGVYKTAYGYAESNWSNYYMTGANTCGKNNTTNNISGGCPNVTSANGYFINCSKYIR